MLIPPPTIHTSTTVSPSAQFSSAANTYYNNPAAALAPNPTLPQLTSFNPMYAAFNGLNGLGGLGGQQGMFPNQGMFGGAMSGMSGGAGFMSAAGAGGGLYDPATLSAMGALSLPKDPLARSTMLAQMAAEKAVLTSRKRKLMDTMV